MNGADERRIELQRKLSGEPQFNLGEVRNGDVASVLRVGAKATLPTEFGTFDIWGFSIGSDVSDRDSTGAVELAVLSVGEVQGAVECPVRVHSCCQTGDVFGSLRCDCQKQLHFAQRYIQQHRCGVIIYMSQEGRGIGIVNKIKAYHLQDLGLDTVEANQYLELAVDNRDYIDAARILRWFAPQSIRLMTNNPEKVRQLHQHGIEVASTIPVKVGINDHNRHYIATKKAKLGHTL